MWVLRERREEKSTGEKKTVYIDGGEGRKGRTIWKEIFTRPCVDFLFTTACSEY